MAKIGLSKPYFAKYTNGSYSDGAVFGKAISMSVEPDDSSNNPLYADNEICEDDISFAGGTVSLTVDDLAPEVLTAAWGVPSESITTPVTGTLLTYGNNQTIPYLGIGGIYKRMKNGTASYVAVLVTKCKLKNPSDDLATQEDEIDWGTHEISGTFMRDTSGNWKKVFYTATEAGAENWLKAQLNISSTQTLSED